MEKFLNEEVDTNGPSQKSRSIMLCHFKSIQSTLFPIGTTTTIPGTDGATVTISASTQPPPPLPSFHSCRAGGYAFDFLDHSIWFIAVWIQDDGNRLRNWRSRNERKSFRRSWQIQACRHLKTKTIAEISKKLDEADSNSQSSQSTSSQVG